MSDNGNGCPEFALIIRTARQRRGMTQKFVAQSIGISVQFMMDLEKGKRFPREETIQKLADTLSIPLDALYATRGTFPPDLKKIIRRKPSLMLQIRQLLVGGMQ